MKRLSRKDIEEIATRVVAQYRSLPEIAGKELQPINPEILVKRLFGLTIDYHHLSIDGTILGVTSYSDIGVGIYGADDLEGYYFLDGKTILIEQNLKDNALLSGRCNFTIAHEASHQILKVLFPNDYGTKSYRQVHYHKLTEQKIPYIQDWEEWQANTLASAILLPPDIVKRCMFLFGLGEKIKLLNKVFAPKEYEMFSNMAQFLGVSKTALAIRLKQLNLLEKDYSKNPYGMIEVQKEN